MVFVPPDLMVTRCRSHHQSVVLRRAFGGWKDEWWTSRKEWCQTTQADCHYRYINIGQTQFIRPFTDSRFVSKIGIITQIVGFRYYLYNLAFQHWRTFVSLQKEKKSKVQCAVQFGKCLRQATIACLKLSCFLY